MLTPFFADKIDQVIFRTDAAGRCTYLNPVWTVLTGRTVADSLGQPFTDFWLPDKVAYAVWQRALRGESAEVRLSVSLVHADQRALPCQVLAQWLADGGGLLGMVQQAQPTALSHLRYRQFFEGACDAAFVHCFDEHMVPLPFLRVNQMACLLLGYTEAELLELTANQITAPESLADILPDVPSQLRTQRAARFESVLLARDGRRIPVELHTSILTMEGHTVAFTLARDMTEHQQRTAQLQRLHQITQNLLQTRDRFFAMMTHELRTPLNAVIGIAHLLQEELPAAQRETLELQLFSAQNLLYLINNILDYGRMEAGQLRIEETDFSLRDLSRQVIKSFRLQGKNSPVQFKLHYDTNLPTTLRGDPNRLTQILNNLIGNAFKFTERGTISLRLERHAHEDTSCWVKLTVTDTGIGIPAEKLTDVFKEYSQATPDTARRFGGSGLGLTITRRLVELMGGRISVQSQVNAQTEFSVVLPLQMAQAPASPVVQDPAALALRVLLVEDNDVNQFIARRFLEKWGVAVEVAANGAEALEKINTQPFDLVLMDLHMPVMDGYETTRRIRQRPEPQFRQLPIYALTADASGAVCEKTQQAGMNGLITKPFAPNALYEVLARHAAMV